MPTKRKTTSHRKPTKKQQNKLLGAAALAGGIGLGVMLLRKRKASPVLIDGTQTRIISGNFPLREGSQGPEVRQLQEALLAHSSVTRQIIEFSGGADGIWGPGTQEAVKRASWPLVISAADYERLVLKKSLGSLASPLKPSSLL